MAIEDDELLDDSEAEAYLDPEAEINGPLDPYFQSEGSQLGEPELEPEPQAHVPKPPTHKRTSVLNHPSESVLFANVKARAAWDQMNVFWE